MDDKALSDPSVVLSLIDSITYQKGMAAVMIAREICGNSNFQIGVSNYLKKFSYSNAKSTDLWDSLNLGVQMKHWLQTEGFPIVFVSQSNKTLQLRQERFFASGESQSDMNNVWSVTLSVCCQNGTKQKVLFDKEKAEIEVPDTIVSISGLFCRICISDEMFATTLQNLHRLSAYETVRLIADCVVLAKSGHIRIDRALALCTAILLFDKLITSVEKCLFAFFVFSDDLHKTKRMSASVFWISFKN